MFQVRRADLSVSVSTQFHDLSPVNPYDFNTFSAIRGTVVHLEMYSLYEWNRKEFLESI